MSEFVSLNDPVRFGVNTHNVSGMLASADETPLWSVHEDDTDLPVLTGNFIERTGFTGSYRGIFFASGDSGFETGKYYEVHASGKVDGVTGRTILKTFVIDDVFDANIVKVSGDDVHIDDFKFKNADIYFADVKYVKDALNSQDEIGVQWFKNATPLVSGQITNPYISLYSTVDGSAVSEHQDLSFAGSTGALRFNLTAPLLASGEPYLVMTSGTIESAVREWRSIIGIDKL